MPKTSYTTILLSIAVLLASCGHQPQQLSPSAALSLENPYDQAMSSSQFTSGEWPSKEWWEIFQDPQLAALIEQAIQHSPTIQKVQARLLFAEKNARKVKSSLFPSLSADYNENWQYFSKNGFVRDFYPLEDPQILPHKVNQIDLSLSFFYEFDFWGKNRKMYRAALGEAKAELAERVQAELSISTLVAFAYFEYQTHAAEHRLYEELIKTWTTNYELYLQRQSIGTSNKLSVLDIAKELYRLEETLSNTRKNMEIDLYMLKSLCGQGPDSKLEIKSSELHFAAKVPLPKYIGADLLARRADLMAMIWRAQAASEEIGVAKTDFYPNVNLTALAGLESLQFPTFFSWGSRTGALQPAIHLPLFTGGKLQANLSTKIAKYNEAVATYNEGLLQASKEVASEISTVFSLHDQIAFQKRIVDNRLEKELLTKERFERGLDDFSLYLISHTEKIDAEIRRVEMESMRQLSIVRLIKSLGGGYVAKEHPSIAQKEGSWKQ